MKKILSGLIALAGIAVFSAFAIEKKNAETKDLKYYFYEVVNGAVNTSSPLNAEAMTIEEFELDNPVSCPSGTDADCVRAWEEGNTPHATNPGDYTIQKDL